MNNTTQNMKDPVENTGKNDDRQGCWSYILIVLIVLLVVGLAVLFFFGDAFWAIKFKAPWWWVVLDILFPIITVAIIAKFAQ